MLTNDKTINISVGASRAETHWHTETMPLSDLYAKLAAPTQVPYTADVFAKLPKDKQGDIKDVGGWVGGTFNAPNRSIRTLVDRDIIVLDADNLPANGPDVITAKLAANFACGYCIHQSASHTAAKPRLRIIIPLTRAVTVTEYEPLARLIASMIVDDMSWVDTNSYNAAQAMHWPITFDGSNYLCVVQDLPPLDPDANLSTLYPNGDWRDRLLWPRSSAEGLPRAAQKTNAEDPTKKDGIIGAFCRVYDIPRVIAKYLPMTYVKTAGSPADRYSYTGGSTTNGAVVYDGKHLYSHHATDPCCGMVVGSVNAWDLVRIHHFGALDANAAAGTPVSRLPSTTEMKKLAKSDPDVAALLTMEKGEKAAKASGGVGPKDPVLRRAYHDFLGGLGDQSITTDMISKLLGFLGITVKYNEITGRVEVENIPDVWSEQDIINTLPTHLQDILDPAGAKKAYTGSIASRIDIIALNNTYNPVCDLVEQTEWDGVDRVGDYIGWLHLTDSLSVTLVRKWLMQAVAMAYNTLRHSYGAEGVLILQGRQRMGKTLALSCITPYADTLFLGGAALDLSDKDVRLKTTRHWIVELGEADKTTAKDAEGLKAFFTSDKDEDRVPYARTAITRARHTVFAGTVNPGEYLIDSTGNRRYWTIPMDSIDVAALKTIQYDDNWRAQLWAQVYDMWLPDKQGFRLTDAEDAELALRNNNHLRLLDYEEEVYRLLDFGMAEDKWTRATTSDLASVLDVKTVRRLTPVISRIMLAHPAVKKTKSRGLTWYTLPIYDTYIQSLIQQRHPNFGEEKSAD